MRRAFLLVALLLGVATALPAAEREVVIVVHPDSTVRTTSRSVLSKIFKKDKVRVWRDGTPAEPVDQVPESRARKEFTSLVHRVDRVETIVLYWLGEIHSGGATPPPQLAGDEQVLEFVRSTPGAVGYVTPSASLEGVRELTVRE